MRKYHIMIISLSLSFIIFCCAPVIRKELIEVAIKDVSLKEIKQNPDLYRGRLFVLGGIIVNTKVTKEGSLIEALYITVDSRGYLTGISPSDGRFLALFPKESGILDPIIFRSKRQVTIAGEFIGTRVGKIDEAEYVYPFFRIVELYLWEEKRDYYMIMSPFYEPYPYWWNYPYWWYRPYWRYHLPPPYWW